MSLLFGGVFPAAPQGLRGREAGQLRTGGTGGGKRSGDRGSSRDPGGMWGVCVWGCVGGGGGELCPGGGIPPPSKEGGAAGQESPGVSALQQPFQFFLAVSGLGLYCLYIEEYRFGFWRGKKNLLVENI